MSKKVYAVWFEPDEKEWIESYAVLYGKSFSVLVREWTLERLEDELDRGCAETHFMTFLGYFRR